MIHTLVCSGYAKPGQTGWELLESFSLDVLVGFAYGELIKDKTQEEIAEIDKQLDALDAKPDRMVEKTLSDGRVIQISERRLAEIRNNRRAMARVPKKG